MLRLLSNFLEGFISNLAKEDDSQKTKNKTFLSRMAEGSAGNTGSVQQANNEDIRKPEQKSGSQTSELIEKPEAILKNIQRRKNKLSNLKEQLNSTSIYTGNTGKVFDSELIKNNQLIQDKKDTQENKDKKDIKPKVIYNSISSLGSSIKNLNNQNNTMYNNTNSLIENKLEPIQEGTKENLQVNESALELQKDRFEFQKEEAYKREHEKNWEKDEGPSIIERTKSMGSAVARAPGAVKDKAQGIADILGKVFMGAHFLKAAWPMIKKGIGKLFKLIVKNGPKLISGIWKSLKSLMSTVGKGILKYGPKIIKSVGKGLGKIITNIGSMLKNLGGKLLSKLSGSVSSLASSVTGFFKNIGPNIIKSIKSGISGILGGLGLGKLFGGDKNKATKGSKNPKDPKSAKTGKKIASGASKGAGKGTAKAVAKGGFKSLVKKIPGVGLLAGLGFGAKRLMEGDTTGAAMEVASGAASMVPGVGTGASLGIDAALIKRDMDKASNPVTKTAGVNNENSSKEFLESNNMGMFQKGGYTGEGKEDEIAGFVHRNEYVISADEIESINKMNEKISSPKEQTNKILKEEQSIKDMIQNKDVSATKTIQEVQNNVVQGTENIFKEKNTSEKVKNTVLGKDSTLGKAVDSAADTMYKTVGSMTQTFGLPKDIESIGESEGNKKPKLLGGVGKAVDSAVNTSRGMMSKMTEMLGLPKDIESIGEAESSGNSGMNKSILGSKDFQKSLSATYSNIPTSINASKNMGVPSEGNSGENLKETYNKTKESNSQNNIIKSEVKALRPRDVSINNTTKSFASSMDTNTTKELQPIVQPQKTIVQKTGSEQKIDLQTTSFNEKEFSLVGNIF